MKNASIALLAGLLGTTVSAQVPAPVGPLPTRMQFCQQEVQALEGEARRAALRTCLVRRVAAEPLVKADCEAHVRDVPAEPASRQKLMQGCVARALSVPSSELPQPVAPIPSPVPAAAPVVEPVGATAAPVAEPSAVTHGGTLSGEDRAVVPLILPDAEPIRGLDP